MSAEEGRASFGCTVATATAAHILTPELSLNKLDVLWELRDIPLSSLPAGMRGRGHVFTDVHLKDCRISQSQLIQVQGMLSSITLNSVRVRVNRDQLRSAFTRSLVPLQLVVQNLLERPSLDQNFGHVVLA
eukprot:6459226-Amphidinium_carterae.1